MVLSRLAICARRFAFCASQVWSAAEQARRSSATICRTVSVMDHRVAPEQGIRCVTHFA
jgi:hypothetical protein